MKSTRTLWVQRWDDGVTAAPLTNHTGFASYSLHQSPGDVEAYARERLGYAPNSTRAGATYPWECTDQTISARVLQSRCGLDWYGRPPENANAVGAYPTSTEEVSMPAQTDALAAVVGDDAGPVIGVPTAPATEVPESAAEPQLVSVMHEENTTTSVSGSRASMHDAVLLQGHPRCAAAPSDGSNCGGSYRRVGTATYCREHYEAKYPPRPKQNAQVEPPPNNHNKGGFMYEVHVTKANGAFTRTSFNDEQDVLKYLGEKAAAGETSTEVKLYEKVTSHSDRATSWHPLEWKLEVVYRPMIVRAKSASGPKTNGVHKPAHPAPAAVMKAAHANVMQGRSIKPALTTKTLEEWRKLLTTGTPVERSVALDGAVYRMIEKSDTKGVTLNTLHAALKHDMGKMSRLGRISAALHRLLFDYKTITKGERKTGPGVLYFLKTKRASANAIQSSTAPALPNVPPKYADVTVQPAHERYLMQLLRAAGKQGILARDLIGVVGTTMTKDERLATLAKCRADGRVARTGRTKSIRYFAA